MRIPWNKTSNLKSQKEEGRTPPLALRDARGHHPGHQGVGWGREGTWWHKSLHVELTLWGSREMMREAMKQGSRIGNLREYYSVRLSGQERCVWLQLVPYPSPWNPT